MRPYNLALRERAVDAVKQGDLQPKQTIKKRTFILPLIWNRLKPMLRSTPVKLKKNNLRLFVVAWLSL
ncbi:hypothetical protein AVI51_10955 [Piscirickettsia salmonis]|nr:hypothetical protein AVI48_05545 [Piscirickettsia salmonis]APS47243.1 hypothetical protein AVI49_06150 [Piscirickettsia salmonis]APS51320.1 hypothetical protein AVI50_11070 [Piscirickettsia salmonis]APS54527.1 hypothetical protein AVI51_10955 [Piscirickettsia salmonis]APS57614.1 hypothetical protein AVI52_10430 [Piscirickettsia salmonis]